VIFAFQCLITAVRRRCYTGTSASKWLCASLRFRCFWASGHWSGDAFRYEINYIRRCSSYAEIGYEFAKNLEKTLNAV